MKVRSVFQPVAMHSTGVRIPAFRVNCKVYDYVYLFDYR